MTIIWLSPHKLAFLTAKWYNTKRKEKVCKFRNQGQVENEVFLLFYSSKYEDARKMSFRKIKEINKIDLNHINKMNNLKNLFYERFLKALNILGKFVKEAFQRREASHSKDSQDLT